MTLKDLLIQMIDTFPNKAAAITFRFDADSQMASLECEYDGSSSKGAKRFVVPHLYNTSDEAIDWDVAAAFSRAQSQSFQKSMAQP